MSVDSIYSATLGEYFLCPDLDGYWRKFRASRYMCHTLIIIDLHSRASSFLDPTTPPIQLIFAWNCVAITSFFSSFLSSWLMMLMMIPYDTWPIRHTMTLPDLWWQTPGDLIGRATTDWDDPSGLLLSFLSCPVKICQDLSRRGGTVHLQIAYLLGGSNMF